MKEGGYETKLSPSHIRLLSSVLCHLIRHEFKQRAVGIPKINAGALAFGAVTFHRSKLDRHPVTRKMCNGIADRALPFEADVAIAGLHRKARHDHPAHARSMKIELGIAEPISKKFPARHHLGADDVAIEGIRALPIGDVDDAVVKFNRQTHGMRSWSASGG